MLFSCDQKNPFKKHHFQAIVAKIRRLLIAAKKVKPVNWSKNCFNGSSKKNDN